MNNRKDIQQLVERYLDGTTSSEEERLLHRLLQSLDTMPDDWRPICAMLDYADSERAAGTAATSMPISGNEQQARPDNATRGKKTSHAIAPSRRWWAAAAAVALLASTATWTLWQRADSRQCFAVIDGELVNDRHVVEQEAERALQLVAITDDEALEALDQMN